MMNGGYLVPANAKKGTLIFNMFRPFDLILFCSGVGISLFLLAIFSSSNTLLVLLFCLPACICGLLVVPIPNYHNVLCALQSIMRFYSERRRYYWKGWCFREQFGTDEKSNK